MTRFGDVRYRSQCHHCGHEIALVKNWPQSTTPLTGISVRCDDCNSITHVLRESASRDTSIQPGDRCSAVVNEPDCAFPQWASGGGVYDD